MRSTSPWPALYAALAFYVMPFADALTGFLIFSGSFSEGAAGSISQLLRGLLLLPAMALVQRQKLATVLLCIAYFLGFEAMLLIAHQRPGWFMFGTIYDFKLVYLLITYFALQTVEREHGGAVVKYFVHGATVYGAILMVTTLLGLNTTTYGEGTFGSKGVFASGNALSLYLGCSSLIALHRHWSRPTKLSMLQAVFLLACAILVGTKASIIFLAFFLLLLFIHISTPAKLALLGATAIAGLVLYQQLEGLFTLAFDVIVYRYQQSDSLFSFLASNRDVYITDALESFRLEGWSLLRLVFGMGPFISYQFLGDPTIEYDTLESDFFDIFFSYGLIGLSLYLALIFYGLILAWRTRRPTLLLAWLGVCAYSGIAGHVAFNGMSGMTVPVLAVLMHATLKNNRRHA